MLNISDKLIGEIVLLVFLLLVVSRPMYKKNKSADSAVILAPISFILAIILISAHTGDLMLYAIGFLSFLVFFTNIRSLQRFASRLYVDRYSILFRIASFIEALCIVFFIIVCILFRPPVLAKRNIQVYSGSFRRGFYQTRELFRPANLLLAEYLPNDSLFAPDTSAVQDAAVFPPVKNPLVVFLPSVNTCFADSSLRLEAAAKMGACILTGDFYTDDMPLSGTVLDRAIYKNPLIRPLILHLLPALNQGNDAAFLKQKELELDALLVLAGKRSSSVIIAAEGIAKEAALKARQKYAGFVLGVFDTAVQKYYERGLADLALTSPADALFGYFGGLNGYEEFMNFRALGLNTNATQSFAIELAAYIKYAELAAAAEIAPS